ncbi:MAG: IS21 family transposase, partial [Synergistales bacterium]|nr:IS21 family transposase [Synergistales bacterium]
MAVPMKFLSEELDAMKPLAVALLPDYIEEQLHVTRWSTIKTDRRIYSVPSRLIGETVRVRRHEDRVEVFLAGQCQLSMPRLTGEPCHAINYRHVIEWLIRKPGAFAQYRFRQDLFPSMAFRQAYDHLCQVCSPRQADMEYLRILRQAART